LQELVKIEYTTQGKIYSDYTSNVSYLEDQLDSQDLDLSIKDTLQNTLDLFSNSIFMEKGTNNVSKKDLKNFNKDMESLAKELRVEMKENGRSLSNDEFSYLSTLDSHFQVYNEWLNASLKETFTSEKEWNQKLKDLHESLLVDLEGMKIFI